MRADYANRGSYLEELVQRANAQYLKKGLARIDKFPTPIAPERVTRDGKVYGHYAGKSTVDYIGILKPGVSVCFDCKETSLNRFPLDNIHQHQVEYMKNIHSLGGIAFILVCFTKQNKHYRMDFTDLYNHWMVYKSQTGGKRSHGTASISADSFKTEVISENGYFLHYLKGLIG